MVGNVAHDRGVRRRHQHQDAPRRALGAEEFEEGSVIRQRRHVERDARRDLALQMGTPAQQPCGDAQRLTRPRFHEPQEALDEGVAADQRAVEIDAEGTHRARLRRVVLEDVALSDALHRGSPRGGMLRVRSDGA